MKGIKGERKCYGIKSPFHALFEAAGIRYQGTRSTNGYGKAWWYIYGTNPGDAFPDFSQFFSTLMSKGWAIRNDLEGNVMRFPERGEARGGATYESFNLDIERNGTLHTLHVIAYTYAKKPARNYISVNEITYPPL